MFWPRVRARALRAPVFLSSLPPQKGRCAPPPHRPSQLRCFLFDLPKYIKIHKVLTCEEYRAVSGVFQNIDPHPLSTQRVCPPAAQKAGGTHSPGIEGVGVNILEDARHWIGLLQYYLSTIKSIELEPPTSRAFFFPLDHGGCEI